MRRHANATAVHTTPYPCTSRAVVEHAYVHRHGEVRTAFCIFVTPRQTPGVSSTSSNRVACFCGRNCFAIDPTTIPCFFFQFAFLAVAAKQYRTVDPRLANLMVYHWLGRPVGGCSIRPDQPSHAFARSCADAWPCSTAVLLVAGSRTYSTPQKPLRHHVILLV